MIKVASHSFSAAPEKPGLLRFRKTAGAAHNWRPELFGKAVELAKIRGK
jgi:hypothetical protein